MKAAIYLRQSLDRSGDELGIERQLGECQRLCAERGYEVSETITDNNRSATTGQRPGYQQLLELIERQTVDVVVVLRIDRLLRRLVDLEALIELSERTGVQIATVQGDVDLSSSSGRLIGRILASVARGEMETKSERHKLANEQAARAGKPHGSRRPYGYEPDLLTIREPEAAVLREMAQRVLAGHSYKEVAWWLNREGHTTTQGKLWFPLTVRNMLSKKRYAGIRDYKGAEYPGTWQPVFDAETWQRLQLTMQLRAQPADTPRALKYLLTGLLYCGSCGLPLNGTQRRDRPGLPMRRVYICRPQGDTRRERGCGGVRRNADALDDWITQQLFEHLDGALVAGSNDGSGLDQTLRDLLDDRRAQQLRIDHLVDDYATGLLTRPQLTRAKATAEAELRAIDEDIDRLNRERLAIGLPEGQNLREAWQTSESDEWRRSLLAMFIKRVDVLPGISKPWHVMSNGQRCRFDPTLIDVTWGA